MIEHDVSKIFGLENVDCSMVLGGPGGFRKVREVSWLRRRPGAVLPQARTSCKGGPRQKGG